MVLKEVIYMLRDQDDSDSGGNVHVVFYSCVSEERYSRLTIPLLVLGIFHPIF